MLLLDVNYNEKDEAKKLGARWNPELKKWYVNDRKDYHKFIKFINGNIIIIDNLYLIEGKQNCFKCGKETRVIGFGIDKYINIDDDYINFSNDDDIHIVGAIEPIPEKLIKYIQEKYNYKMRFSKTTQTSNMSNCCDNCDILQGNFFLFNEVDSPFFITSIDDVKRLKIYKITLDNDITINADYSYANYDFMFKKYGNIIELKL
ncbi:DUF5710 domain-containing protein [Campylobacter sp. MG1]|uniref:DUF5710 domain-containing protein n=1 Tax=Campylobacter sp. MG1 TaxID=2976332 RepID=UPI00226CE723|nr:DUF5710 domain-containing protein [Campylobacter sp. MG1]